MQAFKNKASRKRAIREKDVNLFSKGVNDFGNQKIIFVTSSSMFKEIVIRSYYP